MKKLYPGEKEVERYKAELHKAELFRRKNCVDPDFIGGVPNYEKFRGWPVENVLVWLNID